MGKGPRLEKEREERGAAGNGEEKQHPRTVQETHRRLGEWGRKRGGANQESDLLAGE